VLVAEPTRAPGERPAAPPTAGGLPPWLWAWFGWYLWTLPDRLTFWTDTLVPLAVGRDVDPLVEAQPGYWLVQLTQSTRLVAELAILLGVAAVAVPHVRARWVERRFRLGPPVPTPGGAVAEILGFVDHHAATVDVRVNLRRSDQLAFVYPRGYRRAGLAVFGGLVKLWRADRNAAEAVLLHELAHVARGDHHVSGAGSTFSFAVRVSVPVFGLLAAMPLVISDPLGLVRGFVWFDPLAVLSALLLPVVALWLNEVEADRVVVATGRGAALDGILARRSRTRRRPWSWLLHRLAHPPPSLRRAAASGADRAGWRVSLRCAYPAARVGALMPIAIGAVLALSSDIEWSGLDGLEGAYDLVLDRLPSVGRLLLVDAALLVAWPFVAVPVARLWIGCGRAARGPSLAAPVVAGAIVAGAGLGLLVLPELAPDDLGVADGVVLYEETDDSAEDHEEHEVPMADDPLLPASGEIGDVLDVEPERRALEPATTDALPVEVCGLAIDVDGVERVAGAGWEGDPSVEWWVLEFGASADAYAALDELRAVASDCEEVADGPWAGAEAEPSTQIGGASLRVGADDGTQLDTIMVTSGARAVVVAVTSDDPALGDAETAGIATLALELLLEI
jgi:Zn-dependent protease with chaperone function